MWFPGQAAASVQGFVWTTEPAVGAVRIGLEGTATAVNTTLSAAGGGLWRAEFELDASAADAEGISFQQAAVIRRDSRPCSGAASWIWFPGTRSTAYAKCVLRRRIELPDEPVEAVLMATADDEIVPRLNGETVLEDNAWSRPRGQGRRGMSARGRACVHRGQCETF